MLRSSLDLWSGPWVANAGQQLRSLCHSSHGLASLRDHRQEIKPVALTSQQSGAPYLPEEMRKTVWFPWCTSIECLLDDRRYPQVLGLQGFIKHRLSPCIDKNPHEGGRVSNGEDGALESSVAVIAVDTGSQERDAGTLLSSPPPLPPFPPLSPFHLEKTINPDAMVRTESIVDDSIFLFFLTTTTKNPAHIKI